MNLVTGSTGIVGIRIMYDLLQDGQEVRGLKREKSNLEVVKNVFDFYGDDRNLFDKITWVVGDVLDIYSLEEAMAGCKFIYHCAAVVSYHRKDQRTMYMVNQKGTENVVNVSKDLDVQHICHISSVAAVGRAKIGKIITEKTDWITSKNISYYANTKFGAEREMWRATEEGLNVVILNPGIIFGAGVAGKSSASVFTAVKNGLNFYTRGSGSFIDVRDVTKIALKAMEKQINKERYILVSENQPFKKIFTMIAFAMKKNPPRVYAGKFLLELGWRASLIKDMVLGTKSNLTKESARAAQSSFIYSNEKAKNEFGFNFISSQDSIDYFSEYYR